VIDQVGRPRPRSASRDPGPDHDGALTWPGLPSWRPGRLPAGWYLAWAVAAL